MFWRILSQTKILNAHVTIPLLFLGLEVLGNDLGTFIQRRPKLTDCGCQEAIFYHIIQRVMVANQFSPVRYRVPLHPLPHRHSLLWLQLYLYLYSYLKICGCGTIPYYVTNRLTLSTKSTEKKTHICSFEFGNFTDQIESGRVWLFESTPRANLVHGIGFNCYLLLTTWPAQELQIQPLFPNSH